MIVDGLQDGSLNAHLTITILSLDVTDPLPPPGGEDWQVTLSFS